MSPEKDLRSDGMPVHTVDETRNRHAPEFCYDLCRDGLLAHEYKYAFVSYCMKILVAEDEPLIARQYQVILQSRGHDVEIKDNGISFVEAYKTALSAANKQNRAFDKVPFDVVILDYRMPKKDGLEAAREVLEICPEQRIIFASAYVRETLKEATKELHQIVELLQKPFDLSYLVEVVEDTNVYNQLKKLNFKVKELEDHNLTFAELADLLKSVKRLRSTIHEAD
jgi:CheY-like chemotaxis protein